MADVRLDGLAEWDVTISAVAKGVARKYQMVEWQDVSQELRLWWLTCERVPKYLADDSIEKVGTRKLMRALQLEALKFCQREKAIATGYRVEDLFFYNAGALRELLPMVFDYECWVQIAQGPDDDLPHPAARPAEGNNLLAALVDVKTGLEKMKPADRDLLIALHRDGMSEQDVADEEGINFDAAHKRHDRALNKLRDILGGEQPVFREGPGTRRVLSNSAAQAQTGADL